MAIKIRDSIIILLITAAITVVGNYIGPGYSPIESIPGMLILTLIAIAGIILGEVMPGKIPAVAYIVTLATILTIPGVPFSSYISEYTSKVDFLALCTPILAYAGIYTGKNLDGLKKTGWKIVIVAIVVMLGTYLSSALIAHFVLKLINFI